jgi:hypothetical protein
MKLQLTKQAKTELKTINKRIDDAGDEGYNEVCESLNERELLVCDAGYYVNSAYTNNSFKQLDKWCLKTGMSEYESETSTQIVKQKIGKMLIEDIITIIE